VVAFDATGKGAVAYLNLANEIAAKNGMAKVN
jgi:chromosome partitioning protein